MQRVHLETLRPHLHHLVANLHDVRESNLIQASSPVEFRSSCRRHWQQFSFRVKGCLFHKNMPSLSVSGGLMLRCGRVSCASNWKKFLCKQPCQPRHPTPIACSASISCWLRIPPATMSCRCVSLRSRCGRLNRKALHQAFAIDVRVEKCCDMRFELRDGVVGSERDLGLPALHGDVAILRVDASNDLVSANRRS